MSRVILVVEGETEQAVVRDVIAPELAGRQVYVTAALVGTPGHKGGIRPFSRVLRDIVRLLKQERDTRVGTLFDYFALPTGWPGLAESKKKTGPGKAISIETAMADAVARAMGADFRHERFIPYIQLHELEGLLFTDPWRMAEAFEDTALATDFEHVLGEFNNDPEMIDDGPKTAPSKRIQAVYPRYQKGRGLNAHAPLILKRIGLCRLRKACRHFGEWYHILESAQ